MYNPCFIEGKPTLGMRSSKISLYPMLEPGVAPPCTVRMAQCEERDLDGSSYRKPAFLSSSAMFTALDAAGGRDIQ